MDFLARLSSSDDADRNESLVETSNAVQASQIRRLKNSRRGFVSAITKRQNEIERLLADERNIELVKERLGVLDELWSKFTKAHEEYHAAIKECVFVSEDDLDESVEYYEREERVVRCFNEKVQGWIATTQISILPIDPDDSISQVSYKSNHSSRRSRAPSNVSHRSSTRMSMVSSKCSSRSSMSKTSSISTARIKELTRIAELSVETDAFEKRVLEQEELRVKQLRKRHELEIEMAKVRAKERALATLDNIKNERPDKSNEAKVATLDHSSQRPPSQDSYADHSSQRPHSSQDSYADHSSQRPPTSQDSYADHSSQRPPTSQDSYADHSSQRRKTVMLTTPASVHLRQRQLC